MQAGTTAGVTAAPVASVTVDGVARDVTGVQVTRELAWSPDGSDSGITAATGRLDVVSPVPSRALHPWSVGGWPPRAGVPVTVGAGWGGVPVRQLTGVVDAVSGQVVDGGARLDVVDLIDRLNVPVSWGPLGDLEPDAVGVRRPGLTGAYLIDLCARAAGFCATPPRQPSAVFSAPLQGSARPEFGVTVTARASSPATSSPSWVRTAWGLAASNVILTAEPGLSATLPGTLDRAVQIVMALGPAGVYSGGSYVVARWATGYVALYAQPASPEVRGVFSDGSASTTVVTLPRGASDVFSLVVTPDGGWTITADDGRTATGTRVPLASMVTTPMTRCDVSVPPGATPLAGVQVLHSSVPVATTWQRTAVIQTPVRALTAAPTVTARTARALLSEHASAVGAAWLLDEHGVLRWIDRTLLLSAQPVATLTAEADLLDLHWSSSLSAARSQVSVDYRTCAVRLAATSTVTLWSGRGETMAPGEVAEEFVSPDADTEWIGVDTEVTSIASPGGPTALNAGTGSLTGGIRVKDGQPDALPEIGDITTTVTELGPRTWLMSTVVGALPSGWALTQRTPEFSTVSLSQRGANLPVLRGRGMAQWADASVTSEARGPSGAPALQHDASWYVQSKAAALELADWLAGRVTTAAPVVESLPVVPDLRRQLGDVVIIEDQVRTGVRLTGLITAITVEVASDPARITQTLGVHVITAGLIWPTLTEVDAAWTGHALTGVDGARTGDTLTAFDTTPLEGL